MQKQDKRSQTRNNNFLLFIVIVLAVFLAACNPYAAPQPTTPTQNAAFMLKPVSDRLELPIGGETSTIINLERQEGFNDIVKMTFEGLPQGVEQIWSRDTENGDCTVTLIAHSEVPEGEYTVTLRGVAQLENGTLGSAAANTASQSISISFTPPQPFTASLQPAILPMPVDSVTTATVSLKRSTGFTGGLKISVLNVPTGVSFLCHEQFCEGGQTEFLAGGSSLFFDVKVAANAPQGQKNLTLEISKLDGSSKQTLPFQINIQAPLANPNFRLLAPSLSLSAPFNTPVPLRLTVIRIKGFNKDILLKDNTPGFSADDITLPGFLNTITMRVERRTDSALALPATQTLNILAQGIGSNLSKNVNADFTVLPVSGDRDFSFKSQVTAGTGSADHGLVVQPDGKVVVGSTVGGNFILKRLNQDGSLDSSFASRFETGQVKIGFQGVAELRALALAPDGDIVAVGTVTQNNDSFTSKIVVAKINLDGSLDTAFGGSKTINLSISEGRAVTVTNTGQILIAGQSAGEALLGSSTLQAQATVVTNCVVVALRTNGTLDSSFSGDGIKTLRSNDGIGSTLDGCNAIALAPNNLIVVGGVSLRGNDNRFLVARLQSNGNLDANFDGDGIVVTDIADLADVVNNISVQPNGKIIAGGLGTDDDSEFGVLARYNTSGSLDSTFDGDGIRATPAHAFSSNRQFFERGIRGLALEASGNILLIEDKDGTPVLRRLKAHGSIFDLIRTDLFNSELSDINLDANGKILLLGVGLERRFP